MQNPELPFKVEGITWHALVLEREAFHSMKTLVMEQFGIATAIDQEGFVMFDMPNATVMELYSPENAPAYGYNDGMALGFGVDDIEAASQALEIAGYELLGDIVRMEQMKYAYPYFKAKGIIYAYRHFRAKDGRVYGLNQQKSAELIP